MKKRILSIALAFVMVAVALPVMTINANAATTYEWNNTWRYALAGDTSSISAPQYWSGYAIVTQDCTYQRPTSGTFKTDATIRAGFKVCNDLIIYIPKGITLTVYGMNSRHGKTKYYNAAAGISLESVSLWIVGEGNLVVRGGNAAHSNYGGAAGIGGRGGMPGDNNGNGYNSGNIYIASTIHADVAGGAGSGGGSAGPAYGGGGASAGASNGTSGTIVTNFAAGLGYDSSNIVFDSQGGTEIAGQNNVHFGATLNKISRPTRKGYNFQGFYSEPNGAGVQVYDNAGNPTRVYDLAPVETRTLYAYWTPWNMKVNFDKSGGTGGTGSVTATYGSDMPEIELPTKNGYTFDGYYDYGGANKYYNADGSSAKTWDNWGLAEQNLFAHWVENTATLTYDANGHGTAPAAVTMKYTVATNAAAALTADNCVFHGWNTQADGKGTAYAPGNVVKAANVDPVATTLYAQWHEHDFTGEYKVNNNGTHQQKCDGCDEYNEAVKHTFTNGVCVCGYKCTHSFGEWQEGENVKYRVCETCGYAETESKDEKSDVNFDYNISAFDKVEKADDVEFRVQKKKSASTEAKTLKQYVIKNANQTATVFDISAYVNEVKTQINDGYTVRVKVKIPDGYTNIKVYYIPDVVTKAEDIEEIENVEVKDGYACFNATHFSDYAITGDLEGNLSYEYYLVEAPTLSENGLYNQRSYYINGSNEKVFVEDKLLGADVSIDFAGWYLRTMVQYKMDNGNYDIRFISMLNGDGFDSEKGKLPDYDYAGFNIKIDSEEADPAKATEANTSFLADGKEIKIEDYSDNPKDGVTDYFFLANTLIAGKLVNNDSVITVVPFVKLMNGATVEGKTVTFTIGQLTGN